MVIRLSQLEIQEIARFLEQGKALPEKYRDILFVDQQLPSEDSTSANPDSVAQAELPAERLLPQPKGADAPTTVYVEFLLKNPRIEEVIRTYVGMIEPQRFRPYNRHEFADLAIKCVNAIRVIVPQLQQTPGIGGYLLRWAKRTELPEESAKELFYIIQRRLREQDDENRREQRAKEDAKETEGAERLLKKYSDLVNIFLDIAERKVSVLDEYGDERMHLLDKEVDDCFSKIAGREGKNEMNVRKDLKKYSEGYGLSTEFTRLRGMLRDIFVKHHKEQKGKKKTIEELASLSGVDFETAVGRVLLEHGWHVSATAATGDQGADIIASKGERRVIIQAKRYSGAVGNKAVQEVVGAIPFYGGTEGCVVTNSTFTPAARALAQKNNIRLIDGSRFGEIAEL